MANCDYGVIRLQDPENSEQAAQFPAATAAFIQQHFGHCSVRSRLYYFCPTKPIRLGLDYFFPVKFQKTNKHVFPNFFKTLQMLNHDFQNSTNDFSNIFGPKHSTGTWDFFLDSSSICLKKYLDPPPLNKNVKTNDCCNTGSMNCHNLWQLAH